MIKIFTLAALAPTLFLFFLTPQTSALEGLPGGFGIETVASGLSLPTTAAFMPDGRILIAQKDGVVRITDASGTLLPTPFITLDDVNDAEDRGLIGIAVDPNFTTNGYVYLAYTYEVDPSQPGGYAFDPGLPNCTSAVDDWSDVDCYGIPEKTARVVRVTASGDTAPLSSLNAILGAVGGTPSNPSCADYPDTDDCIASDSGSHSIGGLRFGPDGKLYVATGDGAGFFAPEDHAFRAQDIDHLSGKILRVNTDGTGPSDNPFYNGDPNANRSKVYAYGFRNPYRFNFEPSTGQLYVGNVGWFEYEQINKADAGDNFGWPCFEGGLFATNGYQNMLGCPLTTEQQSDFKLPYYAYEHNNNDEAAIAGGAFSESVEYPAFFRNKYVFGDLIFGTLSYLDTATTPPLSETDITLFASAREGEFLFPVEFITGPDGLIYFINIALGEFNRIIYSAENPIPVLEDDIVFGQSLTLQFDASNSTIIGDDVLSYEWDLGDGTMSTQVNPLHTYTVSGDYTVTLTATATTGHTASTTKVVTVLPPLYDTDPQIMNPETIIPEGPQNVGNSITIPTQITNVPGSGDDPFRVIYVVSDEDGNIVSESEYSEIITLAEGQEISIEHSLFLSTLGRFNVSVTLRSTDYTRNFAVQSNAFTLEVETRSPVDALVPVYRFYSSVFNSHFYTISQEEKEFLEQNDPNWTYEGIAYQAGETEQNGLRPVYRFWSDIYRSHFYTVFLEEKESLEQNDPNWSYEGIGWYVASNNSTQPITAVYRFYSPAFRSHFYTASLAEKEFVEQNDPNWLYEGVGWYIYQ